MRLIFMGTSEFAVPCLEALLAAGHEIAGVWTRVDKPHGRGHRLDSSPVKSLALAAGLPIVQPRTLRTPEAAAAVAAVQPEAICVAAYGLILPLSVLGIPPVGCVNVHASLLPRYRGAAPIHRAVIAGESITGVTTMMMDEGLDTGDMLLRAEEPVGPDQTYGALQECLALRGAGLLVETLARLAEGVCPRIPQDPTAATYAPPVRKEECRIDWSRAASEVHNLVRGTEPRPGAFSFRRGEPLRVHDTRVLAEHHLNEFRAAGFHQTEAEAASGPAPGRVLSPGKGRMVVLCGVGAVEILTLQPAGKKNMQAAEYLRGYPLGLGERLE